MKQKQQQKYSSDIVFKNQLYSHQNKKRRKISLQL